MARAYRARKSAAEKQALTIPSCPSCGSIVEAGVRRRADAVYCSDACRVRAARVRAKARDHDDQP